MHTERTRTPYDDPVPPKPMKNRVIRVSDETWQAAMRAAEAKDKRLSAEIRRWLERYGKDYREDKSVGHTVGHSGGPDSVGDGSGDAG